MRDIEKKEAISFIRKTPIVYRYLPEPLQKDRDVVIAFIKSNAGFVSAYYAAMREAKRKDAETGSFTAPSLVRKSRDDLFLNGIPEDFPQILGGFTEDAEILSLLGSTGMWNVVRFTDENYREKVVAKAIRKGYGLTDPLFDYWYERIPRDKKADEHVREKYGLTTDDLTFAVTAFKCIEVIGAGAGDPDAAYAALFMKCNTFRADMTYGGENDRSEGYAALFLDYRRELSPIFRTFPAEKQNALAGEYYFLAGYIKPAEFDPALAEVIAKNCPIARQLLPDEYVLRYGLHRDPLRRGCDQCEKCALRHILLR